MMNLAYFSFICIQLKLVFSDNFSPMVYPDRMSQMETRFETNKIQYASFLLIQKLLKMSPSISLNEAQKLLSFISQAIKKRNESSARSFEKDHDYWLLRQG